MRTFREYINEMSVMPYMSQEPYPGSPEPLSPQGSKIIKKMKSEKEDEHANLISQIKGMLYKKSLDDIKKELSGRGHDARTVASLIRRALNAKDMSGWL
jgi:hypothetical protein